MLSRINLTGRRCFSKLNLASITRAQVVESKDYNFIGDYLKAVTMAPEAEQS